MRYFINLVFVFFCCAALGQNQNTLPIFALRNVTSWGPNFEDFNPTIAVYKDGTVIFKTRPDSNCRTYCYNYYQAKINVKTIDSVLLAFHIDDCFDTLQESYSPIEAKYDFTVSDASSTFISVHHKTNKTVIIYWGWAENDSLFLYNPKPAKQLHDWLSELRGNIIESKSYSAWIPSTIDVVRETCNRDKLFNHDCMNSVPIDMKSVFDNTVWVKFGDRISKDYNTHLRYEIFTTNNPEEIKYIMRELNKADIQTTTFKRKTYRIFYTFSYDITPFFFDLVKQYKEM